MELQKPSLRREPTARKRQNTYNRRAVLAGAGAGIVGGLAGCLDTLDGGSSQEKPTITLASFPASFDGTVFKYLEQSGILDEEMSKVGYDYELNLTFKDIPLFASGKADMAGLTGLEAAKLSDKQDLDMVIFARRGNEAVGMTVKRESKWDPSRTGSVQATIDKVAAEGTVGNPGWGFATPPVNQIVLKEAYGKEYKQGGGDFEVITTEYSALPKLLADGDVAMAPVGPSSAPGLYLDEIVTPLYFGHDKTMELGLGMPPISGWGTSQEVFDKHKPAVKGVLKATNRGYSWLFEGALTDVPQDEELRKTLGAKTKEQARFIIKWATQAEGVDYKSKYPPRTKDVSFDTKKVQRAKKFLNKITDAGIIGNSWRERVRWATASEIRSD